MHNDTQTEDDICDDCVDLSNIHDRCKILEYRVDC